MQLPLPIFAKKRLPELPHFLCRNIFVFSCGTVNTVNTGRGGGQVVSVLAFYSDDPSSKPAFSCGAVSTVNTAKS